MSHNSLRGIHTGCIRIIAWNYRFYNQVQKKQELIISPQLTLQELRTAKSIILKYSQKVFYPVVCQLLEGEKNLPISHPLAALSPYLDADGILRVGGRLQKASLPAIFLDASAT